MVVDLGGATAAIDTHEFHVNKNFNLISLNFSLVIQAENYKFIECLLIRKLRKTGAI